MSIHDLNTWEITAPFPSNKQKTIKAPDEVEKIEEQIKQLYPLLSLASNVSNKNLFTCIKKNVQIYALEIWPHAQEPKKIQVWEQLSSKLALKDTNQHQTMTMTQTLCSSTKKLKEQQIQVTHI